MAGCVPRAFEMGVLPWNLEPPATGFLHAIPRLRQPRDNSLSILLEETVKIPSLVLVVALLRGGVGGGGGRPGARRQQGSRGLVRLMRLLHLALSLGGGRFDPRAHGRRH